MKVYAVLVEDNASNAAQLVAVCDGIDAARVVIDTHPQSDFERSLMIVEERELNRIEDRGWRCEIDLGTGERKYSDDGSMRG